MLSKHVIALSLSMLVTMSCGGKIAPDSEVDAAIDTTPAPSPSPGPTTTPPPIGDATPVPDPPPPSKDGGMSVDCSAMKASGSPTSSCGPEIACAEGMPTSYANALLSCLVDKCETELGRGAWCGTIMLGLDAMGCTIAYTESPTAGGCVKYQGAYRRWECAKGTKLVVTRPCGG